jgi:hypothetical protein
MSNFVSDTERTYKLMAFENNVLKGIFGPKKDEIAGGRKRFNEELRNLHSLPSTIRMITSRRMKLAAHVSRMGQKRNTYRKETTRKTKSYMRRYY